MNPTTSETTETKASAAEQYTAGVSFAPGFLEPQLQGYRRVPWWLRLLARLGRRYWVLRIDQVLSRAYEQGHIRSHAWHVWDDRLKYHPNDGLVRETKP